MALKTNSQLKELLQVHFDTLYEGFTGYPFSAAEFRAVIKSVIDDWVAGFELTDPLGAGPTTDVSASGSAFVPPLIMEIDLDEIVFPDEMMAGFTAMINNTPLVPGGPYTDVVQMVPTPENGDVYAVVYTMCYQWNTGEEFCTNLANVIGDSMVGCGVTTGTIPPTSGLPLEFS